MNSLELITLSLLSAALCQTPATAQAENAFPFAIDSQMVAGKPGHVRLEFKADGAGLGVVLASLSPELVQLPGLPPLMWQPVLLLVQPLTDGDRTMQLDLPLFADFDYYIQAGMIDLSGKVRANPSVPVSGLAPEQAGILSETQARAMDVRLSVTSHGKLLAEFDARSDGYAWLPVEVDEDHGCKDVYLTLKTPGKGEGNLDVAERLATGTWLAPADTDTVRIFFGVARADGDKTDYVLLKKMALGADAADAAK